MTASVVSVAQAEVVGGTSYGIAAPSDPQVGDILVLIHGQNIAAAPTLPAGFVAANVSTEKFQGGTPVTYSASAPTGGVGIYWKETGGGEPGTYTVTNSSCNMGGVMLRIRGAVFQRGVANAIRSELAFDSKRNLSRSGSTIVQGQGPFNAADYSYDGGLMIAGFGQTVTTTVATLSAPSASMTQRGTAIALSGIGVLVATEALDFGVNPDTGSRQCATDQAAGTGRGFILVLGDQTDLREVVGMRTEGGTGTPPAVANFAPAAGTSITPTTPISFDLTDDAGTFAAIVPMVQFGDLTPEPTHDNENFTALYAGSSRVAIAGGFRYTLTRVGGWIGTPKLRVYAVDQDGNSTLV